MKNTNLILGKTGVGKTCGFMFNEINKIIDNNENLVIVDNKEEYYSTFAKTLKDKGYDVHVINYKDSSKSNGFNPLLLPYKLYKENKIDVAVNLIKNFSLELMKNDSAIDPFWGNSASDYLTGIILLLFKEAKEDEINLGSVQMMISQIEKSNENYKKFKEYLNNLDLVSLEYTFLSGTALAPVETRGGIISVLKMELNKYVATENLLSLLCTNELDLNKINDKTAIFIIGNNDYNRLTNTLLNEIIKVSEINNISFNYVIDNFDTLTKVVSLDDLLETAISDNQKVYIVSRNIESINKKYGSFFVDKFENIVNVNENDYSLIKIENYNEYPTLKPIKGNYFDFIKKLEELER